MKKVVIVRGLPGSGKSDVKGWDGRFKTLYSCDVYNKMLDTV